MFYVKTQLLEFLFIHSIQTLLNAIICTLEIKYPKFTVICVQDKTQKNFTAISAGPRPVYIRLLSVKKYLVMSRMKLVMADMHRRAHSCTVTRHSGLQAAY